MSARGLASIGAVVSLLFGSPAFAQNDLLPLSDEFGNAATLSQWQRRHVVEGWGNEQLEVWDIDSSAPGRMVMVPFTATWYQEYLGPFAFKRVGGDFVITSAVTTTGRDGHSVPQTAFSLGGVFVREPRVTQAANWVAGEEDYVFLSIGTGTSGDWQYEVKTTDNSASVLNLSAAPESSAVLQLARIDDAVIALRREPGQPWVVHRRYSRTDLPDTLQVGLVSYTDWDKVQHFTTLVHNQNVLALPLPPGVNDPTPGVPFAPDVRASFDYARFARPVVPAELIGADLSNPGAVSDAQLLSFLGEAPSVAGTVGVATRVARDGSALGASPNPFRSNVVLAWTAPAASESHSNGPHRARFEVLDLGGRRVATLSALAVGPGRVQAAWDGRDDAGREVAVGVYLARLTGVPEAGFRRIVRIR
ncbi:MAG: hypothetical protein HOP12_05520 [Candidatus Eisenbacteria bacterium]|uniref:FlgD Ig-like domain-containing protein n=1 Tax=Eiseniibacteriota bacterium TaxID=2212470 RepID=A0A849SNW4_UNCEI|nr:hypothetical protein [Candidatus Eisenbacteria bacterium]